MGAFVAYGKSSSTVSQIPIHYMIIHFFVCRYIFDEHHLSGRNAQILIFSSIKAPCFTLTDLSFADLGEQDDHVIQLRITFLLYSDFPLLI